MKAAISFGNGVSRTSVTNASNSVLTSARQSPVSGTGNGRNVASIASTSSAPVVGQCR
jgi:hypothetical protein